MVGFVYLLCSHDGKKSNCYFLIHFKGFFDVNRDYLHGL